jgi:protein-S-isoprenylcysteine O-methyltransferase Ste14
MGRKFVWAFYLVLALEFIYMFSPLYFYSLFVLNPTYSFVARWPATSWLVLFFYNPQVHFILPQIGLLLGIAGFLMFMIGWYRILKARVRSHGLVTDDLYKYCRHPQYLAAGVAGFGLLLALPRYLFIIFFVSLIFIYRGLARREEKECLDSFGEAYKQFAAETPAFIPRKLNPFGRRPFRLMGEPRFRGFRLLGVYLLTVAIFLGLGVGIERASRRAVPVTYTDNLAVIQLYPIFNFYHLADLPVLPLPREELLDMVELARNHFRKYWPDIPDGAVYLVYVEPKPGRRNRSTVELRRLLGDDPSPRNIFKPDTSFGPPLTAVVDRRWRRIVDTGQPLGDSYAPALPLPAGQPINRAAGHIHVDQSHK